MAGGGQPEREGMVRPRLRTSLLWQLGIGVLLLLAALLGRSADILRSLTFIGLLLRGSYDTVRRPASGRAAFDDLSWPQAVVACALILVVVALTLFAMAPSGR